MGVYADHSEFSSAHFSAPHHIRPQAIELRFTQRYAIGIKDARVVGQVEIKKNFTEHTEVIRNPMRKTEADVEQIEKGKSTSKTYPQDQKPV